MLCVCVGWWGGTFRRRRYTLIVILLKEGWKEGVWLKTSLGRKGVYYANEPT